MHCSLLYLLPASLIVVCAGGAADHITDCASFHLNCPFLCVRVRTRMSSITRGVAAALATANVVPKETLQRIKLLRFPAWTR